MSNGFLKRMHNMTLLCLMTVGCASNQNNISAYPDTVGEAILYFYEYYWHYKKAHYAIASQFLFIDDLENYKESLFQAYSLLKESDDVQLCFDENGEEVSAEVFYVNCLEWIMSQDKEFQDFLTKTEVKVVNYYHDNKENTVIFEYELWHPLGRSEVKGFQTLIFQNGKWNIRLNLARIMPQIDKFEIPMWVDYGLTISEVKKYLGIFNFAGGEVGIGNVFGPGMWKQVNEETCYYQPSKGILPLGREMSPDEIEKYMFFLFLIYNMD